MRHTSHHTWRHRHARRAKDRDRISWMWPRWYLPRGWALASAGSDARRAEPVRTCSRNSKIEQRMRYSSIPAIPWIWDQAKHGQPPLTCDPCPGCAHRSGLCDPPPTTCARTRGPQHSSRTSCVWNEIWRDHDSLAEISEHLSVDATLLCKLFSQCSAAIVN